MSNSENSLAQTLNDALLAHEQAVMEQDPDQLFYCSYLISQLNLIAADHAELDKQAFLATVEASLNAGFAVDRLSDTDKQGILSLWQLQVDNL